ncbi:EGF-like domain-containing protein [Haematococcus lacustris]|uniref:EGF-like domain-containing protein n=1 Tax=Haematococcus lacustris TaxID=44745 RepID=A0A699ZTA1_HAELA|nr:EGF-like domain-containing protein [Haematococcus lacustris]
MFNAGYMPTSIYQNASFLLHWGRMDPEHTSGSGWPPDNYSHPIIFPGYQDKDWRLNYKGHPCYTPGKDLVIPAFKHYHHFHTSNLLGVPPVNRDILLSFNKSLHEGRP